jgi:hypothetical protein
MTKGLVLDPSALRDDDNASTGPDAGELTGKTVGFRLDHLWRAWDWVSEVWADELRKMGAQVLVWRSSQGRGGEEGKRLGRELKEFVSTIDIAIVGLGNCGSCTGWTVHDALAAAAANRPTVAVVTANFESLGRNLARRGGRSGLRLHVLPYPLNEQLEGDVRRIGSQHFANLLTTLGARVGTPQRAAA